NIFRAFLAPYAQRIKDGRDAAGGDLRVVGNDGGDGVPMHLGARCVVRLDMVGMQFHETGQQQVTVQVDSAFRRGAFADVHDESVFKNDVPALDDVVGKHDLGIFYHAVIGGLHDRSGSGRKFGNVDTAVRDRGPHVVVVNNRHDGGAILFALAYGF